MLPYNGSLRRVHCGCRYERVSIKEAEKERNDFRSEYPLSRIKKLSVNEYCLGAEQSKNSLCYLLEFGKYKFTGFGIGGGSARKFGVYYSKADKCYKHGSKTIESIDDFWPLFRNELWKFLIDSGNSDSPVVLEDYPLLQGMALVLTKLLCLYYPDKYFTIGSYAVLKGLMDKFHYAYTKASCVLLSYHRRPFRFTYLQRFFHRLSVNMSL